MHCVNLIGNCQIRLKPDKREKLPQRHHDTRQNRLLKFIFVHSCPGGENALRQNEVNPPLDSTKELPGALGFETQ